MQLYQLALFLVVIAAALAAIVVMIWRSVRREAPKAPHARERRGMALPRLGTKSPAPREPAPQPAPERRRKLQPASAVEAAERAEPNGIAFSEDVFSKLEQAFETYQRQSISLEAYAALIMAEQQAVERRIGELRAESTGDEPSPAQKAALEDAENAREAVRWCIEWASGLREGEKRVAG